MSRLFFTNSYFYRYDSKQWKTKRPYPPLGTIYAASHMRDLGYEVSFFDANLMESPQEVVRALEKSNSKYFVIYDDGFNYLTKMCLTNMRHAAYEMAQAAKKLGCTVLVSSSDSTDHFEAYLNNGVDYVMLGEAELTLQELIEHLEEEKGVADVKGIAYKENGGDLRKNLKRPVIKDLDILPQPAWDLIDVTPYRKIWESDGVPFSLNIATTRGCPYKCNWCAKPIYGNRYNSRSPKRVVDEIEWLSNTHGVNSFWMCDDIFGLKPGWVQGFRDELQKRRLNIKYKIQSRVDLLLKEDNIDALVESGLHEAWVGAESGSQKILDAMDKGTQVEQIYEATRILKKKGVRVAFFLQFGYLGEEREDIDLTLKMLTDLLPDDIGVSVSYPLPGTKFYEKVKEELKSKSNWTDSDDLDLMFEGTFKKDFYKRLHRYVHKEYRKHQGLDNLQKLLGSPQKISLGKLRSALATLYYIPAASIDKQRLKSLEA